MRRIALAVLALALLASALPAPRVAGETGDPYGGELRVALQSAPDLNPLAFSQNRLVQELAYDSLTRLGIDQLPVPWLAASWAVDAGAGTVTMDLRSAIWPDGSGTLTAGDVVWSFEKYLAAGVASGFTVAAVDSDTVRFAFTSGGGDFLGNAATLPVAWKSGDDLPMTNGPFVGRSQTASRTELGPNLFHWNGRPYVTRLAFLYPYTLVKNADESTQANDAACALMFRDVHLIGWPVTSIELNTERDCVATYGGFPDGNRTLADVQRKVPHLGTADNPAFRLLELGMNTQRAPLTDASLRQAISRTVDRDLIAGSIESGTNIADSPISPANLAWFNPDVPQYRVDRVVQGGAVVTSLERVNSFLDDVGYLDTDGDGFRQTPAGDAFSLTLITPNQAADPKIAKYLDLITKLRSVGLNVRQEEHPLPELRTIVRSGAYDLFVDFVDTAGEPAFLFGQFHRDGADNVVRVDDGTLNGFLESARDSIDGTARRQAVFDAQTWIGVNAPIAPIVHMRALNAYDKLSWEGWVHGLGGIANFWSFTAVHATLRGPLVVVVDAFESPLRPGAQTSVLVRVRDALDDPVAGAGLSITGDGISATAGTTDGEGQFLLQFTAPSVAASQDFPISVTASMPGYEPGFGNETVTVHPPTRTFDVTLRAASATMRSGGQVQVNVTVYDEFAGTPAAGVTVNLTASPSELGGTFASASGVTDSEGRFQTTFQADVTVTTWFLISAEVSEAGYQEARRATSVEVSGRPSGGVPPTPGLDTVSMVAVVATLAALYGWRQRRKWTAPKP